MSFGQDSGTVSLGQCAPRNSPAPFLLTPPCGSLPSDSHSFSLRRDHHDLPGDELLLVPGLPPHQTDNAPLPVRHLCPRLGLVSRPGSCTSVRCCCAWPCRLLLCLTPGPCSISIPLDRGFLFIMLVGLPTRLAMFDVSRSPCPLLSLTSTCCDSFPLCGLSPHPAALPLFPPTFRFMRCRPAPGWWSSTRA